MLVYILIGGEQVGSQLRESFRNSRLFHAYKGISAHGEYWWWRLRGSPRPKVPHLVKQRAIAEYAQKFDLHVLVETGANYAHMIYVNQGLFREIYSIELDERRVESARRKFAGRTDIQILQGDSGIVLPELISKLDEPVLFWLDGHDFDITTPVKQELDAIYKHPIKDHAILIDDARWFDGRTQYPTMDELREKAARDYPGHIVELKDDIIRIYKPKQ